MSWLRWITVAAMLVIVMIWPVSGREGVPIWFLLMVFAAYNLVVELVRHWVPRLRSFGWVPLADLPVVGLLYFLDHEPGGPTFVLFYLALVCAALTMALRGTLIYTAVVIAVVAGVAPTLPAWEAVPIQLRHLSARLVVFALVGVGANMLTRRLAVEQAAVHRSRAEAERLHETDRVRGDFVASVSHDLRTPLTAARAGLGMLETSAAGQLRPDQQQLLTNGVTLSG